MKLSLLGADSPSLELLRGIAEDGRHELAWAFDLRDHLAEIRALFPGVKIANQWEAFLDETVTDAVIVARGANEDERAEQLRKLVQVGMPVVASHPTVESMLVYYELDMIRREYRSALVPDLPGRHHPMIQRAAQWATLGNGAPIGAVEQIVLERAMGSRNRREVLAQFARDVDLLRAIAGDLTRISAMGGPNELVAFANLGVQMSGPSGIAVRWSVGPLEREAGGRITLIGARGKATVVIPDGGPWRWEAPADPASAEPSPEWNPSEVTMSNLSAAMASETFQPDWVDASRAVEVAESIDRCLEKGHTVELHNETYTEAGTFKGTMTSLGCGLLIAGLGVALAAAVLQQIALMMGWAGVAELTRHWPEFLLGVLVLFLILQFAIKLAAGLKGDEGSSGGDEPRKTDHF